ncbi:MAG TPA: hypothetical protein VF423_12775 [Actinomycetes bacterium]
MSLMVHQPRTIEVPGPRAPLDPPGRFARDPRRAESFYRKCAGVSAFLSGLLVFVSILMIPFDGVGSEGYLRSNLEHPDAIRWAAVVLHYGFLLLVPASFGMAYLSRRGSRSLSNLGLVLAVLGSGLSGLMAVDYYDLALATTLPMDQAVEVYEAAGSTAGAAPMFIQLPSMFGTMLGTVLLALAVRRAGFGSRVAPAAMTVGWVVFLAGAQHFAGAAIGTGLIAVATVVIGLRILYASDTEWESGVPD